MSGFMAEGAGDLARPLIVRDASLGTDEANELGWRNGLVVGIVDEADDECGLPTKVRSGLLEPRNWHESELAAFSDDLPELKDRRYGISLIADHEHEFPGWALDQDEKGPFLDDWFYDADLKAIQKSTRIVDALDPKGRTALLSQLVKVTDDHLGQYTAALVMGRNIGTHYIAAGGYVFDNENDFNGLLDTFWITRHSDAIGAGREGTPHGILSARTDAHFDWPLSGEHGRIKFQRLDLSNAMEGSPLYKRSLGWDPTAKDDDSELGHETGQWRPWYHCVDSPEDDEPPYHPGWPEEPGIPWMPGATLVPQDSLVVGVTAMRELLAKDAAGRLPPTRGSARGRLVSVPLSHHPPLTSGLKDAGRGYLAVSVDAKGHPAVWVNRRLQDPSVPPWWERLVVVPRDVPAGRVPVTDGSGGVVWTDPRELAAVAGHSTPLASASNLG